MCFLRLYSDQLADFARQQMGGSSEADIELVGIGEDAEQSMFQIQLFRDLLDGKLKLPSLPDVALRIQQAFDDNLVTAETVGVIIQSDPVITAKMIMVARAVRRSSTNRISAAGCCQARPRKHAQAGDGLRGQ